MRKKLSRRDFLTLAAGSATGAVLAACQTKEVEVTREVEKIVKETVVEKETVVQEVEKVVKETVEIGAPMEPVEINVWHWTDLTWQQTYDAFSNEHEFIKVNLSEIGEAVFGDQKFLTAVAAGKGPDASIQNRHTFMQFAAKGLYQDVTPYFEAAGFSRDDWLPVQLEETSWQGKIYGLPWFTDVRYLFWNKDQFEEVGLDPETPPATWDELSSFASRLNIGEVGGDMERFGFVPYLFGNSWMWLYGFLNKAPAISDDKRTILCDDPRWTEALEWMVKFYDDNVGSFELANAFSEAVSAAGLGDPFRSGKTSMDATGDWVVQGLLQDPGVNWDAAPMPIPNGGEKSTWSCGWSLVMTPSSKEPEAAWELLRWCTTEEGWNARAEAVKADTVRVWEREQIEGEPQFWPTQACYLPALKMMEENYISLLGDREQRAWALGMDALENWTHGCGTEMGVAALEYWVEMDNAVRNALSKKMTPAEAMAECKAKVQEGTDRAWEAIDELAAFPSGGAPVVGAFSGPHCACES